jgi:hypothetical protein
VTDAPEVADASERQIWVHRLAADWQTATESAEGWWAEEARDRGSFAAFAGIEIGLDRRWTCHAVGDCCLMVVAADGSLLSSFPIQESTGFGSVPSLVAVDTSVKSEWVSAQGALIAGSHLLLVSDAVGQWLLEDHARLAWLVATAPDQWSDVFTIARDERVMVNDDCTVVMINVDQLPLKELR